MKNCTEKRERGHSALERDRAHRAAISQEFVDELAQQSLVARPQRYVSPASVSRFSVEIASRTAVLRRLAEPRTALHPRLEKYWFLRNERIKFFVLRCLNYFSRPSREQSKLIADCIDLISAEIDRANHYAD